jgi:hypothetical protein
MGDLPWIYERVNMGEWRAVVNTVKNLRVS